MRAPVRHQPAARVVFCNSPARIPSAPARKGDRAGNVLIGSNTDGDPVAPHALSPRELKDVLAAERAGEPFLAFRDEHGRLGLFVLGSLKKPVDSGSALVTDDGFLVAFAFERSRYDSPTQFCSWIWAAAVFDALQLQD